MVSGKCHCCGECCKFISANIDVSSSDAAWLAYHGVVFNEHGKALIPCRCLMLTEDNLCSIYEDRPANCRKYPTPESFRFQPKGCRFFS
jgi:Fe-S-cluster containining protein